MLDEEEEEEDFAIGVVDDDEPVKRLLKNSFVVFCHVFGSSLTKLLKIF